MAAAVRARALGTHGGHRADHARGHVGPRTPGPPVPRTDAAILLFEVAWRSLWLGVVPLPAWTSGDLEGALLTQTAAVVWFVIVIAVVPWGHVLKKYVVAPGEPWRRRREDHGR